MSHQDEVMLQKLQEAILEDVPEFELLVKEDSKYMRFLNVFVKLFNKEFMSSYITLMRYKAYFPKKMLARPRSVWKVLTHEWVHMHSNKRITNGLATIRYGLPQWLALLSLVSIVAKWQSNLWLLNLIWLVCLAPLPAFFRAREEFLGYTMSMANNYWLHGHIRPYEIEWYAEQFYGPAYYFMWPFKSRVIKRLEREAQNIKDGKYDNVTPFKEVKGLIEETYGK